MSKNEGSYGKSKVLRNESGRIYLFHGGNPPELVEFISWKMETGSGLLSKERMEESGEALYNLMWRQVGWGITKKALAKVLRSMVEMGYVSERESVGSVVGKLER